MKLLNINTWNRKEHFEFFKKYDQPFFGVAAEVDITLAYQWTKNQNFALFNYYLHKALVAINSLEPFRYRINEDGEVEVHDVVKAGTTINREDNTFSFSYIPYHLKFNDFNKEALEVIKKIRLTTGLSHTDRSRDVVYFSALPWIKFTSVEHAMNSNDFDSVPKIAFGKWEERNGKKYMPVSVHVHHALMDGIHVGQFFNLFQKLLNENN